ncbi:MAG: DUF1573 domain-containing protein [candidate division Zixibacteria bacterium]|nr:DUF1573 domain-containing protein [candidate division Zixibacteria bacterium]
MTQEAIPPGGEGEIEVKFSTGKKFGSQKKTIRVSSNDPEKPTSVVTVTGKIEIYFGFRRPYLRIGRLKKDETKTFTSYITTQDRESAEVTRIETTSPHITAKELKDQPGGHANEIPIKVTISPGLPIGKVNEHVVVHSNLEREPYARLQIKGEIMGDIDVMPNSFVYMVRGQNLRPEHLRKKIHISMNNDNEELKILDIKDSNDILTFNTVEKEQGHKYEIEAVLEEENIPPVDRKNGEITITFDYPEQKESKVSYRVFKR